MAKGKKKKTRKKRPAKPAPEELDQERDDDELEADDDAEAAADDADAAGDDPDEAEDEPDEPAPRPARKGKKRRRRAEGAAPSVDPNLPRPDGENVSHNGGLYFVGTILALIALAVVAQFLLGD